MKDISCFFCTTPFQIISAILLTVHCDLDADLYIVPQFKTALKLSKRIQKCNIFRNVCVVDTKNFEQYKKSRTKIGLYLGIVRNYLRIERLVKSILITGRNYDSMYISSKANVGRLVLLFYYKTKNLPVLHFIDDGESSYDNKKITEASKADKAIRRLIFGKGVLNIIETDRYLFSPKLYHLLNPDSKALILQIPKISESDKKTLRYIFDIKEEKLISEPVVILDILKQENMIASECDKLIELYKIIIKYFGREKVIIKKHPRDNTSEFDNVNFYKDYSVPLEALCIESNFGEKILISAGSTATVLPKVLFDEEPIVLLLNELVMTKHYGISNSKQYYLQIRKMYKDQSRFIIPNSKKELFKSLRHLANKNLTS